MKFQSDNKNFPQQNAFENFVWKMFFHRKYPQVNTLDPYCQNWAQVMAWVSSGNKPLLKLMLTKSIGIIWQNGHQFPDNNFKCIFLDENL